MKICHITCVHGPFDVRIFHKMARSAAAAGHAVTLIAPHNIEEVREGVRIIPINKTAKRLERMIRTFHIGKILNEINADIYHFHDPELIPLMYWFHYNSSKKIIYDVHEYNKEVILTKTWIPFFFRKIIAAITWRIEIVACKSFECTIAATTELAKVYEPYAKRNEFIINFDFKNGIDFSPFNEEADIDIIHVGTISSNRLQFFFGIIEELNSRGMFFNWYFVGVSKELSQSILSEYTHLNQRYINIVQKVPFDEVKQYYQRAKIGISYHPLEKRFLVAIPMKIFEYMKYGLTILASDLPPMRNFISNGVNGIIVSDNTRIGFADAVVQIMQQGKFADTAIINKNTILEQYNWESEAERLLRIYETL